MPETAKDLHITVASGIVQDHFGFSILEIQAMSEETIYDLAQQAIDSEVKYGGY